MYVKIANIAYCNRTLNKYTGSFKLSGRLDYFPNDIQQKSEMDLDAEGVSQDALSK